VRPTLTAGARSLTVTEARAAAVTLARDSLSLFAPGTFSVVDLQGGQLPDYLTRDLEALKLQLAAMKAEDLSE